MGHKSIRVVAREEEEETERNTQNTTKEETDDQRTDEATGIRTRPDIATRGSRTAAGDDSSVSLQRSPATDEGVQTGGSGYVNYEQGPDRQAVSDRLGIDVQEKEVRRLQRLEDEFGTNTVRNWADEGMTADTMGKPQDMQAFRKRQDARPDAVPTDVERQNLASRQRNVARQDDDAAGGTAAPDAVRQVISSPGSSLDEPVQREMEGKMGDSFEDVRIHTGPQAATAADQIQARAFTVGNHVAFNSGEYQPQTDSGKKILAHELTHVRQQSDGRVSLLPKADADPRGMALGPGMSLQPKLEVSSPNDPAEKEAERVAEQVMKMDDAATADRAPTEGVSAEGTATDESASAAENVSRSPVVQRAAIRLGPSQVDQDSEDVVSETQDEDDAADGMTEGEMREFLDEGGEIPEGVPQGSDELVFNVHGYKNDVEGGLDNVGTVREQFDEFEGDVSGLGWDSSAEIDINYWSLMFGLSGLGTEAVKEAYQSWKSAQERADETGIKLAQFFLEYKSRPQNQGTRLILQGHSLGTRVVLEAVRALDEAGRAGIVDTVILLGGAVDTQEIADGRYTDAIGSVNQVHSYVNEQDWVLRFPFAAAEFLDEGEGISAIGREFVGEDAPDNYHEHDVSDELGWSHFFDDYFVDSNVSDDVQDVIRGEVDDEPEEEDDDSSLWDWIWPKLEVGSPDDPAEKEAERVAEEVMKMDDGSGAEEATRSERPAVQRQPAGDTGFGTYVIQAGDALSSIANRFGIAGGGMQGAEQIAEWNDMDVNDVIRPGDELALPAEKLSDEDDSSADEQATGTDESTESPTQPSNEQQEQTNAGEQDDGPEGSMQAAFAAAMEQGATTVEEAMEQASDTVGATVEAVENAVERGADMFQSAVERGAELFDTVFGESGTERRTEDRVSEQAVNETETQATEEAEEAEEELDIEDRIANTIQKEAEAYQNLEIRVGDGETVTVESAYYMNTESHVTDSEGNEQYSSRQAGGPDWIARRFAGELATISPDEDVDDQFNFTNNPELAVEVGKATPSSLEAFIQEAYNEEVIENHDNPTDAQEEIQQWVTDVGIGVDCSGLATHMLNAVRRDLQGDEALPGGDRTEEGEVEVRNRNAATFRSEGDEVETPGDLRPGDAGVNSSGSHVIVVSNILGPEDGEFKFETVESASSADGIKEATHSWESSSYDFYRMSAIDF